MSDSGASAQEVKVAEVVTTQHMGTGSGPICQVQGCPTVDLTNQKGYHFRHRICEAHAKAQQCEVNGCLQRFCQQCGRFHELAAFNGTQRSCKATLNERSDRRRLLRKLRRQEEAKLSGDDAADDSKNVGMQFLQGLFGGGGGGVPSSKLARGHQDADKGGAAAEQQQQHDAVAAAAGIIGAQSRIMAAISAFLPPLWRQPEPMVLPQGAAGPWALPGSLLPSAPPPATQPEVSSSSAASPWLDLNSSAYAEEGKALRPEGVPAAMGGAAAAPPLAPAASGFQPLPESILRLQQSIAAQRAAPPPGYAAAAMPMYPGVGPNTAQVLMTAMAVAQQQDEAKKSLINSMAAQHAVAQVAQGVGAVPAFRPQLIETTAAGPLAAVASAAGLAAAGKAGEGGVVAGKEQPLSPQPITASAVQQAASGPGGGGPSL